jgi:acetate---CoA ligase (ADP-forming)
VSVRPVTPADVPALETLLESLSIESRVFRFFSAGGDMPTMARRLASVSEDGGFGVLALSGADETPVGHAMYAPLDGNRAEIAFEIADRLQGQGLGTLLLGQVADAARRAGVETLEAVVLPENARMLQVFARSGFPIQTGSREGQVWVRFSSHVTPEVLQVFENREALATAAAVRHVLEPESVAVIGASRQRGSIGAEVFHNLLAAGFPGPVYPINPSARVVQSVPAYRSVAEVPGPVELAVITVPAERVLEVVRECGEARVRALVIITAGFAERGGDGVGRQQELLELCRQYGMRLCGPNCMGVMNVVPRIALNATFAPSVPPAGNVGFMSQSGGLGLAVIEHAARLGLGLSQFVSIGNKADLSGNDFIQYWESDPETDVILLYLESFGNPRKFSRLARRVARGKPIVAVKSGRTAAGARATSSHTGALLAASDATVDALFRKAGVIRTESLHEMFDVAGLLAHQPLPAGERVGIVTNAGGPAILCADACSARGLKVPEPSAALQRRLARSLPRGASVLNPIDMLAEAGGDAYRKALVLLAESGEFDALVAIFVPPLVTSAEEVAHGIAAAATKVEGMPVATVFMSARGLPAELRSGAVRVPSFEFPEDAAVSLAHAAHLAAWRRTAGGEVVPIPDARPEAVAAVIERALAGGAGWMAPDAVRELLVGYGIPLVPTELAETPAEAGRIARRLGGEVVLKAAGAGLVHKTEAGAVRLGLRGAGSVERAASEMAARLQAAGTPVDRFLVQPLLHGGVEMLVGLVQDPSFGPVLACGAGGTAVELIGDVGIALTPVTEHEVDEMLRSLRTYPLLTGFRGSAPVDVAALKSVLHRVSALAEAHPEIAELELNPLIVLPQGAAVVDARVRVEPAVAPTPLGAR